MSSMTPRRHCSEQTIRESNSRSSWHQQRRSVIVSAVIMLRHWNRWLRHSDGYRRSVEHCTLQRAEATQTVIVITIIRMMR